MKMAEEICFFHKNNTLVIKAPKRSPLIMRMVMLVMVMVSGVYIFSTSGASKLNNIQVINNITHQNQLLCTHPHLLNNHSESIFRHYPKPTTFRREECECNSVRLFAIVSMQRSGSGWFETMLNSHINVSSNGEIFSVKERRSNALVILKTLDQVYNLDWFTSASKNECSAAVGLKWMLNQAQVLASYKPRINAIDLKPKLKQEEETIAKALDFFNTTRHILLYYEDLLTNTTTLRDVQEFLKLPYRNLTSRQVKIHSGSPLARQVENWDEIQKTLNQTTYERFLRADY